MNQSNVAPQGVAAGVVAQNPNILHGAPVFPGTRVPVRFLQDCLEGGGCIEEFLCSYPNVTKESALAVVGTAFELAIGPRDDQNLVR